jgi:quinol monooxygenase YgiN
VEAAFASASAQKHTVTFSAELLGALSIGTVSATSGTGAVYSGGSVEEGNNIVFTATVRSQYAVTHKLSHWVVDGVAVPKNGTTYTHYLNAAVTVKAVFVEIAKVVSVTPSGTNAPTIGSVAITFSCEMDTNAIATGTVELEDVMFQTTPLTGGVWSNNNKTYTVAYSGLNLNALYTVNISVFKDADGNVMVVDNTNFFTTTFTVTYGVSTIALTGGAVTPDFAAYTENDPVTLTVSPDPGYVLDTIFACKTGDPVTDVLLAESSGNYIFNMPAYGVTITAIFINPNQDAVDDAKGIIEGLPNANWRVAMTAANTESDVKAWLRDTINAMSLGIDPVAVNDITIVPNSFTAATTGTSVTPSGSNGAFTFTVTLKKGSATAIANASTQNGEITATAYVDAETPAISSQPQDRTVTQNTAATLSVSVSVSDGGTLSYQWYRNTANSNISGTPVSGETLASYSPPTVYTGTVYYYVVITNTNTGVTGTHTATATSNVAIVTVTATVNAETPYFSSHPLIRTVTQGGSSSLSVQSIVSDGGTLSYQWYRNTSNSNSSGTAISGATSYSYSPPTATTGTLYYYVTVTNTNNNASGTKIATATSNVVAVTVSALASAETPYIYSNPQSRTVTQGNSASMSVSASVTDGGALSYQWYQSTLNRPKGIIRENWENSLQTMSC